VRFVFTPPADHAAGLLTLPWPVPLAEWHDERLIEIRQRGISRHVVRFVYDDGVLYALKELNERLARREYRVLRALADRGVPAVEAVGIAVDRDPDHPDADAILVEELGQRYQSLWQELNREEILRPGISGAGSPSGCTGSTSWASTPTRSS